MQDLYMPHPQDYFLLSVIHGLDEQYHGQLLQCAKYFISSPASIPMRSPGSSRNNVFAEKNAS